jgi:hypothetical protein
VIQIDLPADLNLEDDRGRNIARLADAVTPDAVIPGAVLVAGTPRAWSWAVTAFPTAPEERPRSLAIPPGVRPGAGDCRSRRSGPPDRSIPS